VGRSGSVEMKTLNECVAMTIFWPDVIGLADAVEDATELSLAGVPAQLATASDNASNAAALADFKNPFREMP
jgi:hypothetical protein